jgi:hypothetical protein
MMTASSDFHFLSSSDLAKLSTVWWGDVPGVVSDHGQPELALSRQQRSWLSSLNCHPPLSRRPSL